MKKRTAFRLGFLVGCFWISIKPIRNYLWEIVKAALLSAARETSEKFNEKMAEAPTKTGGEADGAGITKIAYDRPKRP